MCRPLHSPPYHDPRFAGRLSEGGTMHPVSGGQQACFSQDDERHQSACALNTGYSAAVPGVPIKCEPSMAAHGMHHRSEEVAAAETICQIRENCRRSHSSEYPPTTLEPPLTAGSQTLESVSPPTPEGGGCFQQGISSQVAGYPGEHRFYQAHQNHTSTQSYSFSFRHPQHIPFDYPYSTGYSSIYPTYNLSKQQSFDCHSFTTHPNGYPSEVVYNMCPTHASLPSAVPLKNDNPTPSSNSHKRKAAVSATPTDSNKKKKGNDKAEDKNWPDYVCFTDKCKNNKLVPPRKTTSQFLGRNKRCTAAIPYLIFIFYCRKCYQQRTYRAKKSGKNASLQKFFLKVFFTNAEKWPGERKWTIVLSGALSEFQNPLKWSFTSVNILILENGLADHYKRIKNLDLGPQSVSAAAPNSPSSSDNEDVEPESPKKRQKKADAPNGKSTKDREKKVAPHPADADLALFVEEIRRKGLLGDNKTTLDCQNLLWMMGEFSKTFEAHSNNLPLIEFQPDPDCWPDGPAPVDLIYTETQWALHQGTLDETDIEDRIEDEDQDEEHLPDDINDEAQATDSQSST